MIARIALVGYGLIGRQRHAAIDELRAEGLAIELAGYLDPYVPRSDASPFRFETLDELMGTEPTLVIVSIPHDDAVEVTTALLHAGLNVLMEKPMGRDLAEADGLVAASTEGPGRLNVGMNYRFYAGIRQCIGDAKAGRFGSLVSCHMRLGHGGAPGDEQSWKLDPIRAGGGCLIDPGIHLLDLALHLADDASVQWADGWSGFWQTGIEEECRLLLGSSVVPMISIDVSIVRWRSQFSLEIWGSDGYGIVTGRGRSYGPQVYRRGTRWGWQGGSAQGDSEVQVTKTDGSESFRDELRELLGDRGETSAVCDATQARRAMAALHEARSMFVLRETPSRAEPNGAVRPA